MKRLLLSILLANCFWCKAQYSNIEISTKMYDTIEQQFLNGIEAKLLKHIDEIQKHKIKADVIMYSFWAGSLSNWAAPLTKAEFDECTLSKEKIATNKYLLHIKWDSSLDTAYVIGFSREYYWKKNNMKIPLYPARYSMQDWDEWQALTKSNGAFFSPIYNIQLNQYKTFLTGNEIKELNSVIKRIRIIC